MFQLYFLNQESVPRDPSFTTWKTVLSVSIVQNASIITACIPFFKPLVETLETGMMSSSGLRGYQKHHRQQYGRHNSYKLSDAPSQPKSAALTPIGQQHSKNLVTGTGACSAELPLNREHRATEDRDIPPEASGQQRRGL